ncbi:MAG: RnfABCDGE type electron transport complex subunit D [Treponema sp.]|jgi:electron transport complex protein RnfD|nr:RnfABCDGE type electron transport complex subunit D [Treponema sp.]
MEENRIMADLLLASSPHIASPDDSRRLMGHMLIALTPVTVFGVLSFGLSALLNILVSLAAAELAEFLFRKITRQDIRNGDLSAAITGLLLALIIPPGTPLWITALGSVFAIIVAKEFFGGLGANVFNPALTGRAFLIMSFPAAMTTWNRPTGSGGFLADAVTGATPLGILKVGETVADVGRSFAETGLAASPDYWPVIKTMFIGYHGGSTGETSALLILAGCFYLLITKTIDWRAPAAMIAATVLGSLVLGMDPLIGVLGGGVLFGAVFMATDYVSGPITALGKLIFGCGAGLITVLIRKFGNYPEGVTYGILIMNAAAPFLNKLIQKKYGFVPKKKPVAAQGGAK